jgi:hypothetical protein
MGSCRKDGAVIVLENFQPRRNIGSVFLPRFLLQFEIGTQESRCRAALIDKNRQRCVFTPRKRWQRFSIVISSMVQMGVVAKRLP